MKLQFDKEFMILTSVLTALDGKNNKILLDSAEVVRDNLIRFAHDVKDYFDLVEMGVDETLLPNKIARLEQLKEKIKVFIQEID